MQERLFERLELDLPAVPSTDVPTFPPDIAAQHLAIRSQDLDWQPHATPVHRHAGREEILLLEGDVAIADAAYHVGDYIL